MKRFWLFFIAPHDPSGGMGDFDSSYDSFEEAMESEAFKENTNSSYFKYYWEVFDSKEFKIIRQWDKKWELIS